MVLAAVGQRVSCWRQLRTIRSYHDLGPTAVHLLGAGASGSLLAYHLQQAAKSAGWQSGITLQLRRRPDSAITDEYGLVNIVVREADLRPIGQDRFAWQVIGTQDQRSEAIDVLIVTTKADQTIEAVRPLVSRLTTSSRQTPATMVLVQNGVGMDEELIKTFEWQNDPRAPFIVRGITSNGSYSKKRFETVHSKGNLQIALSAFTAQRLGQRQAHAIMEAKDGMAYDAHTCTLTSILHLLRNERLHDALGTAFYVNHLDFDVAQQRKLVVNCVANPLTALYDIQNGEMRTHPAALAKAEEILIECASILEQVYRAKGLDVPQDLTPDSLRSYVWHVIHLTRENYSSTVQDLWSARGSTEIDYFNGTMVRWAESLKVPAPHNTEMVKRMHAKAQQAYLARRADTVVR